MSSVRAATAPSESVRPGGANRAEGGSVPTSCGPTRPAPWTDADTARTEFEEAAYFSDVAGRLGGWVALNVSRVIRHSPFGWRR